MNHQAGLQRYFSNPRTKNERSAPYVCTSFSGISIEELKSKLLKVSEKELKNKGTGQVSQEQSLRNICREAWCDQHDRISEAGFYRRAAGCGLFRDKGRVSLQAKSLQVVDVQLGVDMMKRTTCASRGEKILSKTETVLVVGRM
jgi:hypothetical protein